MSESDWILVIVIALVAWLILGLVPGMIASRRHHRNETAITLLGLFGIFTFGILWIVAFVWAFTDDRSRNETDEHAVNADVSSDLEPRPSPTTAPPAQRPLFRSWNMRARTNSSKMLVPLGLFVVASVPVVLVVPVSIRKCATGDAPPRKEDAREVRPVDTDPEPEQPGANESLSFFHGENRFEIDGPSGLRKAKTTIAVDTCVAYSAAHAALCERCTERRDDRTYDNCFNMSFGGSLACYKARRIRDIASFRSDCLPKIETMTCADYRASGPPLACREQIHFVSDPSRFEKVIPRATASSTYPAGRGYTFYPANLVDGDVTTSWQPQSHDSKQWVRYDFPTAVTITEVAIANGFQVVDKLGDQFTKNNRIASGRLRFAADGDGRAIELPITFDPDRRGLVRFPVPHKRTRTVWLLVETQAKGTQWQDLAISEVTFDVADTKTR